MVLLARPKRFELLTPRFVVPRLLDDASNSDGRFRCRLSISPALPASSRVQVHSDRIDVTLDQMALALWLNAKADKQEPAYPCGYDREQCLMVLTIRGLLKRTGIEMRIVVDDGSEPVNVDPVLVRLLVWAHGIRGRLLQDPSLTLKEIAAADGVSSS